MIDTYYNGAYTSYSELKIPLTDRSILFGDGIYEAAIAHGEKIYLFEKHLLRLAQNLDILNIPRPIEYRRIHDILKRLIRFTRFHDSFLYFQISRSEKVRKHSYDENKRSNLLAFCLPFSPVPQKDISLITETDTRYSLCNIKTINLIPAVMASHKAEMNNCCEAVFIRDGIVTECAHSNIFIRLGDTIFTHPKTSRILPGITRGRVIELASGCGFKIIEESFSKDALFSADEVFITSTSKFTVNVKEIDGIQLQSDNISASELFNKSLLEEYFD